MRLRPATALASADGKFEFSDLPSGSCGLHLVHGENSEVLREFSFVGERAQDLGELIAP